MKTKKIFRLAVSMILAFFLLVTISPPARAAGTFEVGDWSALDNRINAIVTGDTIKLTADISIPGNNYASKFDGKNVTFDLNGYTLQIGGISVNSGGAISIINTNTGANGTMTINSYLEAKGGSVFGPVGSGVLLNVNGQVFSSGIGSSVTANNISNNSYAISAENGGQVTVNGNITVNTSYTGVYGVSTDGSSSTITVNGNISVNGNSSYGVKTGGNSINANVTVNGSVTATGNYSSGVFVQGGSNQVNVLGGDVVGVNTGASINGGSGNRITVHGSVLASGDNGSATSIGFGSGHIIAVNGDVTANGTNAKGALISSTDGSMITVGGNITSTGDGAYISGNGSVTVGKNITAGNSGANISGGGTVHVGGDIFSSSSGAIINGGGTVDVSGNITAAAASDSTAVYGFYINNYNMTASSAKVTVGGNISASTAFAKSAYGAYINNYNSTDSTATVSVTGSVYAVSSGASAVGAQIYNYQSSTAGVTVGGYVEASGTDTNTAINAAGTEWSITAGGILAKNGTSNTGVAVSGSGTVMTDSISADSYIKIYNSYTETPYSPGNGVLNEGTGYFEYINGNTIVNVKGRTLTVAAETGGKAGIGGTVITSGKYEAGTSVSLIAVDSTGYDFDTWTATSDGSFSSANSASTTFTMPANNATVTAKFKTVPIYTITDSSAMSGGSITASLSPAEAGNTVTLTVKPDFGKLFMVNSLKYTYNSVDYPLTVTEGSSTFIATFIMPASDITVSAQFVDITVPIITTKTLPNGMVTASYSQSLVYESNAPVKWSIVSGTLPPGLTLSDSGVISGKPSAAASYTFTVQAENAAGADTQELTIDVAGEEPVIITTGLPAATEDSYYSAKLEATGISGINWDISEGSLPDGLYLDNYSGIIDGIPSVEINSNTDYTFKVKASNWISTGYVSDIQEFTLTVHPAPEFLLTLQTDGHGSITTGAGGNYEENSVISIGATPDSGYVFSGWTTSDGGSFDDPMSTPTSYTMPGNAATVTANFVPGYNVNISQSDGGSITASTSFAASGVQITLTVAPELGMQLSTLKYSYGGQDYTITVTDNTAVFTMPASDVMLSALFVKKPAIEVLDGDDLYNTLGILKNGDTIKLMDSFVYSYSEPIEIDGLTVILDTNGYTLTLSNGSYNSAALTVGNGGELVLTGSGALNIYAYNGVYVYNGGKATVTNVSSYLYPVYADNGTVTVTGDVTAVGEWSYAVYAYEGSSVRVEGNVTSQGNNSYAVYAYDGAVVTVNKAIISSRYVTLLDSNYDEVFLYLGDGVLNNTTGYFEYSTDSTTIRVKAWDLMVVAGEHGSITTEVSGKYESGAVIPISATASDGYSFGSWTCSNGGSFDDASNASTTFTMPAANVTVTAGFEKIPTFSHTVTVNANPTEGGSVSGGGTYEEGASVTVTASANIGYTFVNWTDDEGLSVTNSVYSFNMGTADINLTANFQAIPVPVTTGTITGIVKDSGSSPISGATVSLTVGSNTYSATTAADGSYSITDVPAGTGYTVVASMSGYVSGSAVNVNVTANLPTSGVNITLNAIPESSSGGSAGTDTPPETFKITTSTTGDAVTASTTAKTTVDSDGKTMAAVTQAQISEAINQAVAEAQRQGEGISARVEIKVDAPTETTTVETSIPKESVKLAVEDRAFALALTTPIASITFDVNALSTISAETTGDVKIKSSKLDVSTLSAEAQKIVGDRPIFDFSVTSGDRIISQFGGNISVSVPYTPKRGEDTNCIVIYYINAEGKPETVSNCTYNSTTGCVTFITNHFSQYVVGYNKVSFKDVARNAWYNKAVSFIAARGITTGTGNGNYSPGKKLTRGEFIVIIMRAYGIAPDTNPKDNFTDSGNTYYTGYLAAAKRLGISGDVGNNMFVPGKEITRQEMFSLLYNAQKVIDQLPEGTTGKAISEYSDLNQIAAWAKEAMTLFVKTGTISGSGDKLSPTDTTTRAELAQVLYNLLSK